MLEFAADAHISAELFSIVILFPSATRISEYYFEKNPLSSKVKPLSFITSQFHSILPKFVHWIFFVKQNVKVSHNRPRWPKVFRVD